jgi:hypothetical protein
MSDIFKFGLAGIGDNVQLGKRGSRVKNSSGSVDLRNAADSAFVKLRILAGEANDDGVNKGQMDTAITTALTSSVKYKGIFNASAGNYSAIINPLQGWLYKISVAGTINGVAWEVGDNLIVNKVVTGSPVAADIDKIDNTEAADILRTGDISADADFTSDTSKFATRATIKTFVDTAIANTAGSRTVALVFGSSSTVNIGATVPANAKVKRMYASVSTPFNGTTESTMTAGHSGDADSICDASEIDLHIAGHYEITCDSKVGSVTQYAIAYTADGATAGAAEIVIEYAP